MRSRAQRRQDALKDENELEIDRERGRVREKEREEEQQKRTVRNEMMKEAAVRFRRCGDGGVKGHTM